MYETNKYTLRYFISFTCVFTILISCVQLCVQCYECVCLFVHWCYAQTHCIAPKAQNVYNLHLIYMCIFTNYRMEWDSNPRYAMHTSVFKTDTFDRSDIHPVYHNAMHKHTHCTTMHVYTRPDKGISIIWSLCVPYVQMHSTKFVYVCTIYMCIHTYILCTICLWYLRQYHLKLYGA